MRMWAGTRQVEVDESLVALARPRLTLTPFQAPAEEERQRPAPLQVVMGTASNGEPVPLGGEGAARALRVHRHGTVFEVERPGDAFEAEAAIKLAFCAAVLDDGGLLLHASAAAFSGRAIVAVGRSGAGKSTLAGWCQTAGARILSDECVAVFPDGRVYGTPFSSDPSLGSEQRGAELAVMVTLRHAEVEHFEALSAARATSVILEQAYRPVPSWRSRTELLARAQAIASCRPFEELRLRNAVEAGLAARERVAAVGHEGAA